MIAKKTVIQDIKLADFPEEIDEQNNIKLYGETSWENQLAVLSHYLHNNDCIESKESKREVIYAIREFLEQKKESKKEEEWAVAGLLHDLDSDIVGRKPGEICEGHATTTVELLKKENFGDEEMYRAILGHHDGMGVTRTGG